MFSPQMAAAHPLRAQTAVPPAAQLAEAGSETSAELAAERELVASAAPPEAAQRIPAGSPVARLPVEVDISIPVREFRVRNLLAIAPGDLLESRWPQGEDLPLAAGDVRLAWSEFEVIDTLLAVRVTRMA